MKALDVQRFPAVRLFMERAGAAGSRFELDDSNAPVVAEICGRLDGLALAIELVAARVGSHGITATAKLLAAGLGLDWHGRRTAHPRHQTLRELLDWSYGSLGQMEQRMLRRLSVFVGPFSIDAMRAVAGGNESEEAQVILAFDDLVAKSLVSVTIADDSTTRYSLLETTRVYACEKLDESGERARAARLHAAYYTSLLETACGGEVEPHPDSRATSLAEHLGNVRVALDWCLGGLEFTNPRHVEVGEVGTATGRPEKTAANDAALGVQLTAAAIPLFMEFSLLNECHKRCTVALEFLDDTARDTRLEMLLQEARAITSAWTLRNGEYVHDAIAKSLCIAVQLGETAHHLRLLVGLHIFLIRAGKFRDSRAVAEHLDALASDHRDDAYRIMSDWMRGSSEHFIGNQAAAQQYLRRGFARPGPRNVQSFGLDYRVRALVTYARVLWLSGAPDRAMVIAREAIDQAAEESRPVNVCFALLYTAPVFLWCGAYDDAKDVLKSLKQHPNWNALPSFHATGLALEGELLVRLGELDRGIAQMTRALKLMKLDQQNVLVSHVAYSLAESLAVAGRFEEAHSVVCAALAESADDGDTAELAELLRIKGAMLFERTGYANMEAEDCLQQSLSCARRQFAASWELRTAITLARVRAKQGRSQEARNVLSSVYNRFTEGFDAPDQKVARILLSELN
jgi:predicted ATPase